jgi:hypothetical protein
MEQAALRIMEAIGVRVLVIDEAWGKCGGHWSLGELLSEERCN